MPPRTSDSSACDRVGKVISRLFASGSVVSELNGATFDLFPAAIPPREGEALARWVTREGAEQTIEIGLGHGVAALFACHALLAADAGRVRHVTIDPLQEPWFGDTGLQVLEEAGVIDIVEFHREESLLVLPRLLEQGRRFDLGFVDGDHRFDGVFLDLVYLDRLVRPGGTVFVDDLQRSAIARAVNYCTTNLAWQVEERSTELELHNWIVLRTPARRAERGWHHHVDF